MEPVRVYVDIETRTSSASFVNDEQRDLSTRKVRITVESDVDDGGDRLRVRQSTVANDDEPPREIVPPGSAWSVRLGDDGGYLIAVDSDGKPSQRAWPVSATSTLWRNVVWRFGALECAPAVGEKPAAPCRPTWLEKVLDWSTPMRTVVSSERGSVDGQACEKLTLLICSEGDLDPIKVDAHGLTERVTTSMKLEEIVWRPLSGEPEILRYEQRLEGRAAHHSRSSAGATRDERSERTVVKWRRR